MRANKGQNIDNTNKSNLNKAANKEDTLFIRFLYLFGFIFLSFVFLLNITAIHYVPSSSMSPTIEEGMSVYTERNTPLFLSVDKIYKRGDIITFCHESKNVLGTCVGGDSFIKRIVGLPGETVEMINGDIYINGKLKKIDAEIYKDNLSIESITLADDEYYVLGDNRKDSVDSRFIGPIPLKEITGKAYILLKNIF